LLGDESLKGESQHTDRWWFVMLKIHFISTFKMATNQCKVHSAEDRLKNHVNHAWASD